VEDNVAVVEALGEESAIVVGHDWGANIAPARRHASQRDLRADGWGRGVLRLLLPGAR
jgi:pimeloyl-ACP methyl ester carboxylesterase